MNFRSIVKTTIGFYPTTASSKVIPLVFSSILVIYVFMAVPPSDVPGEVDTEAELSALAACFDKLTWALPLNDITPKLIAKRVMTIPDKQEIATMSSDKQKVTYFLEKCIQKPLSCGDRKNFDHLMDIMRQNRKAAFLVEELEKELAPPPASE